MRFPNSIDRFLPADGEPVVAKARRINDLARLCEQFLPAALARHARAANLKDGTLVILADNSAVAAKLKLFSESLGEYLSKRRPEVNSVSVRVQPALQGAPEARPPKNSALSPAALQELSRLHQRLSDSPARRALAVLLARHDPKASAPPARKKAVRAAPKRQSGRT